jgi:hypothetical protein
MAKTFKPCAGCPSPAACAKAGKCMMAESKPKKMMGGGYAMKTPMMAKGGAAVKKKK